MRNLILAGLLVFGAGAASAQQMRAVAVSPDGGTVLAAGDNRVLYTIDAGTLAVTDRRYVPGQVRSLEYSADGRMVFVRTDDRVFSAHAASSFKTRYTIEEIFAVAYAPAADRLALLENSFRGGALNVVVASTGEVLRRIEFPEIDTEILALSPDGTRALILTGSTRSDSEPNENPSTEMKGYERYLFRQQNDGYVSTVVSVNLEDGSWETAETFYRVNFPGEVRMLDGKLAIMNGTGDSALLSADGGAELLDLGSGYVASGRIANDGRSLTLTGGTEIRVHAFDGAAAGEVTREMDATRLPGPAERVTEMDEAADGTLYMVTSAYRIWKLAPGATEVEVQPVY
jgi:hypothetical protein